MSVKDVKWFERKYGGSLEEAGQSSALRFAFVNHDKNGTLIQCHDWIMCKDYLHDVIRTALTGEGAKVYGFTYNDKNMPIDLNVTKMLITYSGIKDLTTLRPRVLRALKVLHAYERMAAQPLSRLEKVASNEKQNFHHIWMFTSPKFWMTHPHLISLYVLLIRLCDKQIDFSFRTPESIVTAFERLIETDKSQDVRHLEKIYKKIVKLILNRQEVSAEGEGGFSEVYHEGTEIYNFHNYAGVVNTCAASTKSDTVNKNIKNMFKGV